MRYVQIDTTADPNSSSFPSSAKQRDLALILHAELQKLGLQDVEMDEWSYVFATIPSNVPQPLPTICFCSHMDPSPIGHSLPCAISPLRNCEKRPDHEIRSVLVF